MKKLFAIVLIFLFTFSSVNTYAADDINTKTGEISEFEIEIKGLICNNKIYVNADNLVNAFKNVPEVRVITYKKGQADQETIIIQSSEDKVSILAYYTTGISTNGIIYTMSDEVKMDRAIYYNNEYYIPLMQTFKYFGYDEGLFVH